MSAQNEKLAASATTVAVFTGLFPPAVKGGGPIRSTAALVEMSPKEFSPVVITSDRDLGDTTPLSVSRNQYTLHNGTPVIYASTNSLRKLLQSFALVKAKRPSILYFNSFFNFKLTIIPLLLWRIGYWGSPMLLLAPRGEFGNGALARRSTKKRLFMLFFRVLRIHKSLTWHSTAPHETEDIQRQWGEQATVVVRQNETLLPLQAKNPQRRSGGGTRFAFVSRIVEHKGLEIALRAFSEFNTPVTFDIYGAKEDEEYFAACEELALTLKSSLVTVSFKGFLQPEQVRETLNSYDALILPTAGENFGHIIAEALSASCPVITTSSTPWTEILNEGAGVAIEGRDPKVWRETLLEYAALGPLDLLQRRAAAGEAYVRWRSQPQAAHVWTLATDRSDRGTV